ncbi:MAG: hypothetical protein AAGF25_03990 [Pseudomonadota bacterium]
MAVFVELRLHQAVPNTILINLEQIISVSEYTEEVTHVNLTDGDSLNVAASHQEVSRIALKTKKQR